jgi:hypothetical protein
VTEAEAHAVYDVLVRECGADDNADPPRRGERSRFVRAFTSDRPPIEWRFQGALGFGGKLYPGGYGEPHRVGCYREDETPERRAMVERANEALREMVRR